MLLLIPYGHERQTVQRLPLITFGLILLNVIVFLTTHYSKGNYDEVMKKHEEAMRYVYEHPYLKIPASAEEYFEEYQLEELSTVREASNTSEMDPEEIAQEQKTLDRLFEDLAKLSHQNPFERFGYVPARPSLLSLLTCMFVHGGWGHLLGNMFFLYLAGCSIEDLWGRPLYIGFYLLSGVVATLMHALKFSEATEPIVGASGAIAGLMGAFMVRFYDTKISFFYMLGLWYRGTFKAPAYIMLPLWLGQQILYATVDPEGNSGVAFWAHIGGFIFGAFVAFGFKQYKVEEKYIAPKIEKKVALAQNPNFLQAMDLSEQGRLPDALILLHKAVREDPNHLDAYMEMRRIAQIQNDVQTYTKASGAIMDILLRTRESDLLLETYHQYQQSPLRHPLAPRTLLGLGSFFEEIQDYQAAATCYEELAENYPLDAFSMKGLSKLSRLYFDKLNQRQKGTEAFWNSYHHTLATDQWRSALLTDKKRYNIPESTMTPVKPPAPAAPVAESIPVAAAIGAPVLKSEPISKYEPPVSVMSPATARNDDWVVQPCRVEKITLKGIELRDANQALESLVWKRIQAISVGRIRIINPATSKPENEFLVSDLIVGDSGKPVLYRIHSHELAFDRIFPRVEQSFEEAYQNFMGIIINNSGARCLPNREACVGPNFATYPDISRYETRVKERLKSS